jgi:hypothetical protein
VFYAIDTTTTDVDWRANFTEPWHMATYISGYIESIPALAESTTGSVCLKDVILFMVTDLRCIWVSFENIFQHSIYFILSAFLQTLINMVYCCLILFGHSIQRLVFGELRVSEAQQLKEKFWNFVFYKFIFIFGVVNVQHLDEVVLWCSWFSVVGFLLLLAQLCKDRFEYVSENSRNSDFDYNCLDVFFAVVIIGEHAMANARPINGFAGFQHILRAIAVGFMFHALSVHGGQYFRFYGS